MLGKTAVALAALLLTLFCIEPISAADSTLAAHSIAQRQLTAPVRISRIVQTIDASDRATLSGNTNRHLIAGIDGGPLADDTPLDHLLLGLSRSADQEQALDDFIAQLHDPASPNFHQWLTADEFGQLFGPAQADVDTVVAWLQDNGFVVNEVAAGLTTIDFSGTAAQVNAAFGTTMKSYDVAGAQYISNAVDPTIPAALAPVVSGIVSLNSAFKSAQSHRLSAPVSLPSQAATRSAQFAPHFPNFTYTNPQSSGPEEDVAPGDFNIIYNVNPVWAAGHRGAGQTVAVIERTEINPADWNTFRTSFGLSAYAGTLKQTVPTGCSDPGQLASGDQGEAALDAEWAGVAAPDASIQLVACADTSTSDGIDLAVSKLFNLSPLPKIVSLSYGSCESSLGVSGNSAYNNWWHQAASEGITVFVSSGDEGAAGCDDGDTSAYASEGIAVNGLASTQYNVAVGGTDFRDFVDNTVATYWTTANSTSTNHYTSAKSYVPEIPWNDSCAGSILLTYINAHGGNYASNLAFCNSSTANTDNLLNIGGGSGGPSIKYTKPSWQAAVYGAPSNNVRGIPDVSLFASNGIWGHGLVFCMSDSNAGGSPCVYSNPDDHLANTAGGTSFAAPAFAGIQALINQVSGQSWGNMNTEFYALAAAEFGSSSSPNTTRLNQCNANLGKSINSTCVFNDITSGDITVPCAKGTANCYSTNTITSSNCDGTCGILSSSTTSSQPAYAAKAGWDFATGLGSVNVANLVDAFAPTFTVTASANAGGTITPSSQIVNSGSTATFTVTPNSNYHVGTVSGDTCTVSNTSGTTWKTNAITKNCVVTATFAIDQYTVTASVSGSHGTITPPSQTVNAGSAATFVVTPDSGYHVSAVTGSTCTITDTSGTTWTSSGINQNCAVTATFAINQYTITASVTGGHGAVTPTSQTIDSGNTASITVTPDTSYHVNSVSGDTCTPARQGTTTTWTTGTIAGNCTITATFAINTYAVAATVNGAHGTISPSTQNVNAGDAASFTITPDAGYQVIATTGDTCTIAHATGTTWTSNAINANCAVTVTFGGDALVFTAQPGDIVQGSALGSVAVTEEDASGNVVDDNALVDFTVTACGGTLDLGSVQMVHGVATLNSTQRFYTVSNGVQINASSTIGNTNSSAFNVTANADFVFADGFEGCNI